jgi:hypothetical protein
MDVIINETRISLPVEISTWGDLLEWVETDYLKAGECITHVYLSGNEAVNYRNAAMCGKEITNVTPVVIKSGDFDRVLSDSMSELDHELASSIGLSNEIIRLLEDRKEEEAYARLAQLLDSIQIFFAIISEDPGFFEVPNDQMSRQRISAALEKALMQLVAAQEKHYWVQICDVLEYEIAPMLESWQKLVSRELVSISTNRN